MSSNPNADLFDLFERAVELEPGRRQAFVAKVRADDPQLAEVLARMLAADASGADGPEELVASTALQWSGLDLPASGERLGGYTLLEQLGEGGMGVVYGAREEVSGRTLAIKVMRPGVDTEETLARFRLERTLLARLRHPGICPILDLGTTPAGLPFFVMPRIEGVRIDEYCDAAALANDERLRLFLDVCSTVAHAHARGVLHRDLKPSNILVSEGAEGPVPVLIDFGVARVLDPAEGPSGWTRVGRTPGTPDYMSPELLDPEGEPVDTRADVYALGVVLSELLSGVRPVKGRTTTRPSVLLREGRADPAQVARCRSTDAGSLIRTLQRDVDWIVIRAVEADPALRYPSVDALADDVGRVLEERPVRARPADLRYRVLKAWRRAPEVVAATVAVAVLLAGGALATVGLAAAARVDQKSAEARLAEVERLADGTEMWARLAEVEALAPVAPGLVAEAEAWQARTLEVVERLPLHRAFADSLEALGRPEGAQADTARARLEQWERVLAAVQAREPDPEVARRLDSVRSALAGLPPPGPTRWLFEDEETAWLHASSRQVLAAGERLLDPDPFAGGIADVERRRRISAELAALADTREWRAAWRAARERIVRSQVYGGLELPVQDGLVPLGPDPRTGLEEFWHVPSGTRPRPADAGPGRWAMDGRSGIVFILVPGGSFTMGAQSEDPGGLHHDPRAPPSAAPVHEVRLDPYFISRYELSRGQRLRLAGVDPDPMEQGDATDPLAYPTDRLSLERAVEVFARYGLTVPTEAQWETAARAGSTGPHPWQGEDFSGWANLADARFEGEATVRGRPFAAGIDDGWAGLAPVGRQRPNAWGVHDVMGNLMEVVRGGWFRYPDGPEGHREGDGLIPLRPGVPAVARGGNFTSLPTAVRLSTRSPIEPSVAEREIGVRAARPVRP